MSEQKRPQLSEHIRQRTQEWLRKAEHELAYLAVAPLDIDDPPTDTTCRIAHITAEYALKAYLLINKHKILKSHDLIVILDECITIHNDQEFETLRSYCQTLTIYRTICSIQDRSQPLFQSKKHKRRLKWQSRFIDSF